MLGMHMTHDIDHLGIKDHYLDGSIIRFACYRAYGVMRGRVSLRTFSVVMGEMLKSLTLPHYDSWDCLDEWLALEDASGIRSAWFVACRPGRGISYSTRKARVVVDRLRRHGCIVGLHSQCRDRLDLLPQELEEFSSVYNVPLPVPVRMHYLACSPGHTERMRACRDIVSYDSSVLDGTRLSSQRDFERPINIMEGNLFSPLHKQSTMTDAKQKTLRLLRVAKEQRRDVVLDFHQRSLSRCLPIEREYILWLYERMTS